MKFLTVRSKLLWYVLSCNICTFLGPYHWSSKVNLCAIMTRYPLFQPSAYSFELVPIIVRAIKGDEDIPWDEIEVLGSHFPAIIPSHTAKRRLSGPADSPGPSTKRVKGKGKAIDVGLGKVQGRSQEKAPVISQVETKSAIGVEKLKAEGKGRGKGKAKAAEVMEHEEIDSADDGERAGRIKVEQDSSGEEQVFVWSVCPNVTLKYWIVTSH